MKLTITRIFTSFIKDESGQDLVEYALLLGVLAAAGVTALATISPALVTAFNAAAVKAS